MHSDDIQSDHDSLLTTLVGLPDFLSRRIVHLLDGFAGQVTAVLVAHEIEYFHGLVFAAPFAILNHQSLNASSN